MINETHSIDNGYTVDEILWVTPTIPTILGDLRALQIPPTDLSFASIEQTVVMPGPLNNQKFAASFAYALSNFPHAAGRLRCESGKWHIELTNSANPIIYGTSQLELTEEMLEGPHPHLTKAMATSFAPTASDEPLMKAMVTYWPKTGDTSFGLTFSHIIGDGFSVIHFVSVMSRFYNDRPPYPPPTFEKFFNHEEPTLERTLIQEMLPQVPHLAVDYPQDVFYQMYNKMMDETAHMRITLTAEQLSALQKIAQAQAGNDKLTKPDAMAAYIITILNRISPSPIRQIINILDYRGCKGVPGKYEPPGKFSTGNVILQKFSEKLPENRHTSLGVYAALMRNNVLEARQPEFIRRYVAITKELRSRSATSGRIPWWWTYDDSIGVNNLIKRDFKEMSFGYPGKERFYLFGEWERYFRIFPANPVRLADGSWNGNVGAADAVFRLKQNLRPLFLKTLDEDMGEITANIGRL